MDKSKELPAATQAQKSKAKKVDRMEEALKDLNRDLTMTKMKSMFAVGISMIGLFGFLNSTYVFPSSLSLSLLPFFLFIFKQNLHDMHSASLISIVGLIFWNHAFSAILPFFFSFQRKRLEYHIHFQLFLLSLPLLPLAPSPTTFTLPLLSTK